MRGENQKGTAQSYGEMKNDFFNKTTAMRNYKTFLFKKTFCADNLTNLFEVRNKLQ
jgi:hypothetical protein